MVDKVNKRLSSRSVGQEDVLDFINRELVPTVEKIRLLTSALLDRVIDGAGSPEGVVAADKGALYLRTDGGVGSSVYYKSTDAVTTGWVALP